MSGRKKSARGVALITAMLITAITGSLAAGLAWNNALDVRRTMVLLFHEQGAQIALGAESWISNILRDDSADTQNDHLGELWASELPGLPVDNDSVQGAVTGKVEDLNGRFNVNNLLDANSQIDPDILEQFQRLLRILDLDPALAGMTADWIDADRNASFPDGAEDSIYTSLTPGYRTYNRALANVTELSALQGMDKASFDTLQPHVTALPAGSMINVNTATPAVLASLGDGDLGLDTNTVEQLLSEREDEGFSDYAQTFAPLLNVNTAANTNSNSNSNSKMFDQITDKSRYFQLKAVVQIDTVRVTYYSTLFRDPQGAVTTILRSMGTL